MEQYNKLWITTCDPTVITLLAEKGVDVNMAIDTGNWTMLMGFAIRNNIEMVKLLLTLPNINVNVKNTELNTCLHLTGDIEIIKMLVGAGADINAVNKDNMTPIMYNINEKKVKYLASKGADLSIKNNKNKTIHDMLISSQKEWLILPLDHIKNQTKSLCDIDVMELIMYLCETRLENSKTNIKDIIEYNVNRL